MLGVACELPQEERTALMFAAEEGHVGAARVLLDCGAEFAIKDDVRLGEASCHACRHAAVGRARRCTSPLAQQSGLASSCGSSCLGLAQPGAPCSRLGTLSCHRAPQLGRPSLLATNFRAGVAALVDSPVAGCSGGTRPGSKAPAGTRREH